MLVTLIALGSTFVYLAGCGVTYPFVRRRVGKTKHFEFCNLSPHYRKSLGHLGCDCGRNAASAFIWCGISLFWPLLVLPAVGYHFGTTKERREAVEAARKAKLAEMERELGLGDD